MIDGMTTKIAISLPDEQVAEARAAVAAGRAPSVSAYVSEALARRSAEEELLELLDEDEARGHPTTEEHREWARQALAGDPAVPAEDPGPAPASSSRSPRPSSGRRVTRSPSSGRYSGEASAHRSAGASEAGTSELLRYLTPREREALRRMAEGESMTEIAHGMGISSTTARTHVQNLMTKLGVRSRRQATALVARNERDNANSGRSTARPAPAAPA